MCGGALQVVSEKTSVVANETFEWIRAVETDKLANDVKANFETIDNKPVTVGSPECSLNAQLGSIMNLMQSAEIPECSLNVP